MYIRSSGYRRQFSCTFLSGRPADETILHVVFYPDVRLTAQIYKKFLAGSPADGSQRVKIYKALNVLLWMIPCRKKKYWRDGGQQAFSSSLPACPCC